MQKSFLRLGLGGVSKAWVDKLIIEYENGRRQLSKLKADLTDSEIDKLDKTQINGMIREMSDVIKWLKTGRDPFKIRGIDKRSAYQKRVLYDMDLFPSLDIVPEELQETERELTEEEKELITDILLALSPRERECYLLYHVNQLTYKEIHEELKISRASVQTYIDRARAKIKEKVLLMSV